MVWGSVISAVVLVLAGGIVWRMWGPNCSLALVAAVGTVIGGILSLVALIVVTDQDAALRASFALVVISGAWLLSWSVASGIRGQRLARELETRAAPSALRSARRG